MWEQYRSHSSSPSLNPFSYHKSPVILKTFYVDKMKKLLFLTGLLVLLISAFSCSRDGGKAVDGNRAHDFTLSDINGKKITLSEMKDKVVMIEFWATWCPPCRQSIPDLNTIYEKYKDRGFVLLAISLDKGSDAQSNVMSFMKEYPIAYTVLLDNGETGRKYGVNSIPTSFIIDKNGRIVNKHIGYSPNSANAISQEIEALL